MTVVLHCLSAFKYGLEGRKSPSRGRFRSLPGSRILEVTGGAVFAAISNFILPDNVSIELFKYAITLSNPFELTNYSIHGSHAFTPCGGLL